MSNKISSVWSDTEHNGELLPFDLSCDLKDLGFDLPCFAYWGELNGGEIFLFLKSNFDNQHAGVLAPTVTSALKFFRDKYKLHSSVDALDDGSFIHNTTDIPFNQFFEKSVKFFDTFEEAQLDSIRFLIQIIKEKNDNQ